MRAVFVGLATLDVLSYVDTPPGADGKATALEQAVAAGGPATNAAVTFAALGGTATLVTALGSGPLARVVRDDLRRYAVAVVDTAPDRTAAAPVSSITVSANGDRSIVGIDATAIRATLAPDWAALLADADVLLIDGHLPDLAVAATRAATAAGIPVVLDAGRWKPVFDDLLPDVDHAVCSADFRIPAADAVGTVAALLRLGVPTVVRTAGAAPVRWWSGGRSGAVVPPVVTAVDTLGAGDAFHGAYCAALAGGRTDVATVIRAAAEVAALRCTVRGPRAWLAALPSGGLPGTGPRDLATG